MMKNGGDMLTRMGKTRTIWPKGRTKSELVPVIEKLKVTATA
jgi:hypothetical protein